MTTTRTISSVGTEKKPRFSKALWHEMVEHLAVSFNLETEMRERLEAGNTARLIGALPFLAGCDHPVRTAVLHLGAYLLALTEGTKEYFLHTPADDESLDRRLQPIMQFCEGDPVVLSRGMNLLKLQMVAGYLRDVEADMRATKYNPVAAGVWNAEDLMRELRARVEAVDHPEMDAIMSIEDSIRSYWSP